MTPVPLDKQAHFLAGWALAGFVYQTTGSLTQAFWWVAAAAALKELYDWFNPWSHSPEMRDAIATVCGVLPLWASVKLMAAWPDLLPGFFKLFVF